MSLSPARGSLAIAVVLVLWSTPGRAVTPDPRLFKLVPPGTRILAGINAAPRGNWHGRFVLFTRNLARDWDTFRALSGSDASRVIQQVILAAQPGNPATLEEHSLLASGHFNQERIYGSAIDEGGMPVEYHGLHLVQIKPSAREHGDPNEFRWLAVLDASVLLLGTVTSVKQELNQRIAPVTPDPKLTQMLGELRRDDDAWSVVLGAKSEGIREALMELNPELAKLADGKVLRLGIHYGRNIEFEYNVGPSPESHEVLRSDSMGNFPDAVSSGSHSLFVALPLDRTNNVSAHGTVKVSPEIYDRWLDEVARRDVKRHVP